MYEISLIVYNYYNLQDFCKIIQKIWTQKKKERMQCNILIHPICGQCFVITLFTQYYTCL